MNFLLTEEPVDFGLENFKPYETKDDFDRVMDDDADKIFVNIADDKNTVENQDTKISILRDDDT